MSARRKSNANVTIIDVAREADVSYSTVSRVLNNEKHVRPDKRARVMEAAEKLGYIANRQARHLAGGRSGVIGLLVPDLSNSYIGEVARGIDTMLAEYEYDLMLHTTHRYANRESQVVNTLVNGATDGLLLLVPLDPNAYVRELHERGFPYVVIDHQGFDDFSSTVSGDNTRGAYEAVRYLLDLGHRRIGFIAGQPPLSSSRERLAAYQAALAARGIPFDPELVVQGGFQQSIGYTAAAQLLELPQPPTAIFAANDLSAFGAMQAARAHGLSIPDDISILGFDDLPQAINVHPALTTVRQPLFEMGRVAARLLLNLIEDPNRSRERIVLDTELIIRESCQPPAIAGERSQAPRTPVVR